MNIILIGMRGSGKNTVGKLVAKKLSKHYIDVDQLIVSREEMAIKNFVEKYGWNKFREIETKIMERIAHTQTNAVIATGGGAVENKQNISRFQYKKDVIIWLKCSIKTIIDRIGNKTDIPFLTDADNFAQDLKATYRVRKSLYKKYAHVTISSEEDVETVVNNIITKLKERKLL